MIRETLKRAPARADISGMTRTETQWKREAPYVAVTQERREKLARFALEHGERDSYPALVARLIKPERREVDRPAA